jgi:hypothetical protein
MTGKLGLGEVLCHVQGKLFNHGPATDQVLAHGLGAQRVITHALIQFVLDNSALALATALDQLLCPGGVTRGFHKWAGSVEGVDHYNAPF